MYVELPLSTPGRLKNGKGQKSYSHRVICAVSVALLPKNALLKTGTKHVLPSHGAVAEGRRT